MENCNVLMMSWVVAHLHEPHYIAHVCSSGTVGYAATMRVLTRADSTYPELPILLLTNIDDLLTPTTPLLQPTLPRTSSGGGMLIYQSGDSFSRLFYFGECRPCDFAKGAYGRDAGSIDALKKSLKEMRQIEILPIMNDLYIYLNTSYLPPEFLSDCPRLTSLNFSIIQENHITTIPSAFLATCKELTFVNFAGFGEYVTTIQGGFMTNCSSLTSVHLESFRNVTIIEDGFLSYCSTLQDLDLSPLSNITDIPDGFLQGCSEITKLSFNMKFVKNIPFRFLYGCANLQTIIFEDMTSVTEIPDSFLSKSASLTTINLTGLKNVTSIKSHFLAGCVSLKSLDLSPFGGSLGVIPSCTNPGQYGSGGFLRGCTALKVINLSGLEHLLPRSCMNGGGLKDVEREFLSNINPVFNT